MNGGKRGRGRGSAIEKALQVLNAICDQPQPIGLPDIAARIKLPRQTVHRVLRQLEDAGLVIRDVVRDRFSVGPQLGKLALSALYSDNQSAPMRTILHELVGAVQETCNIGVLRGFEFVYLARVECDWPLRSHLHAGTAVPAHCSSGGKAILAFMPDAQQSRLLRWGKLKPMTEKSITDPSQLGAVLAEVRENGYALSVEEMQLGLIGVGVPICDTAGRALAALVMHGPLARIAPERAVAEVPRLQGAARRLAQLWAIDNGPA